jgi:siroheme synthase-like protein
MRTHPVFLCLEGRRCVAIGGDDLIAGKVEACREAGGDVTVVSSALASRLRKLADAGRVRWLRRDYRPGDLAGAFIAYARCREPDQIALLRDEAARERVLLNVVDVPDACSFFAGAVVSRGDLQVAIGTGGASPSLAASLRRELEGRLGEEYGQLVAILGAVRRTLAGDPTRRQAVMASLVASPLADLLRRGDRPAIDALLSRIAGAACTLDRLGCGVHRPSPA